LPQRVWRHLCKHRQLLISSPTCHVCGEQGLFDGWRLSMWEQAARYHYVYGLNPFGSHRSLADRLLAPRRKSCSQCVGSGVLDVGEGTTWRDCLVCEGTGSVWNCSLDEVDAILRLIIRLNADSHLP
jgi:hypothetical protein